MCKAGRGLHSRKDSGLEHSSWAKPRRSSTSEQGGLLKGQGELLLCQGPRGLVRAGTGHRTTG